jgi:hypothetical protein
MLMMVPVLLGEVHDAGAPRDPRVVHQHVDAPEGLHRAQRHAVDRGQIAHVGVEREALAAEPRRRVRGGLGRAPVHVRGHHPRARPHHRERDGAADAVAGAGDDRDPVGQHHVTTARRP